MTFNREVWTTLNAEPIKPGILAARQIIPGKDSELAAVSSDGRRHLLLKTEDSAENVDDQRSAGLAIMTKNLIVEGMQPARYIDIECIDTAGFAGFDAFITEVIEAIGSGNELAGPTSAVLAKWRKFWGLTTVGLSGESLRGLFGELWFLRYWLAPKLEAAAVSAWTGPAGARFDFQWKADAVEVKTSLSTRGPVFTIHGLEQLSEPANGTLFFFGLRLREEPTASNSLPAIVAACRECVETHPEQSELLEMKLGQVGYHDTQAGLYEETRLRVVDEMLLRVQGNFPRLVQERITGDLFGIERVEYDINLTGMLEHRIKDQAWRGEHWFMP